MCRPVAPPAFVSPDALGCARAQLAGCERVVLCSPPNAEGRVEPHVLYAARRCGITEVFKLGGAQAVAAMALGTDSVPRCDKLFGPGNAYVTEAKLQLAADGLAIDMPAGPSGSDGDRRRLGRCRVRRLRSVVAGRTWSGFAGRAGRDGGRIGRRRRGGG